MKKIQTNKATHVKTLVQLQLTVSQRLLFVELTESMVVIFFSRRKTVFNVYVVGPSQKM